MSETENPPKPNTPEHYKWIQETYFGGKPPSKLEDKDNERTE